MPRHFKIGGNPTYVPDWGTLPPNLPPCPWYERTEMRRNLSLTFALGGMAFAVKGLQGRVSMSFPAAFLILAAVVIHLWPYSPKDSEMRLDRRIEGGRDIEANNLPFKQIKTRYPMLLAEGLITRDDINRRLRKDLEKDKLDFTAFNNRHGADVIPYLDEHNRALLRPSYIATLKRTSIYSMKDLLELPWSKALGLTNGAELLPDLIENNQALIAAPGTTLTQFLAHFSWSAIKHTAGNIAVQNLIAAAIIGRQLPVLQQQIFPALHLVNCGRVYLGIAPNHAVHLVPKEYFPDDLQECLQTYQDQAKTLLEEAKSNTAAILDAKKRIAELSQQIDQSSKTRVSLGMQITAFRNQETSFQAQLKPIEASLTQLLPIPEEHAALSKELGAAQSKQAEFVRQSQMAIDRDPQLKKLLNQAQEKGDLLLEVEKLNKALECGRISLQFTQTPEMIKFDQEIAEQFGITVESQAEFARKTVSRIESKIAALPTEETLLQEIRALNQAMEQQKASHFTAEEKDNFALIQTLNQKIAQKQNYERLSAQSASLNEKIAARAESMRKCDLTIETENKQSQVAFTAKKELEENLKILTKPDNFYRDKLEHVSAAFLEALEQLLGQSRWAAVSDFLPDSNEDEAVDA